MDAISQNGLMGAGVGFVIGLVDYVIIGRIMENLPRERRSSGRAATMSGSERTRMVLNTARFGGLVALTAAGYFAGEIALG